MGLLSTFHASDDNASFYNSGPSLKETRINSTLKQFFEKHWISQIVLLLVVLLGTGMVIGDGVLTPSMSGNFFVLIIQGCMDCIEFS